MAKYLFYSIFFLIYMELKMLRWLWKGRSDGGVSQAEDKMLEFHYKVHFIYNDVIITLYILSIKPINLTRQKCVSTHSLPWFIRVMFHIE